ncbi:trypsin-like peptidase domain-containing protein [Pseudomonas sp. TNT2022 ID1048]|uniref:trypsin-like serine peptidase n=1 Tax=Pseudomonas idahonensis TaxID=2942628 RepID=UPI00235F5E35|nr:trypsin-like peptidase domain-containing protein [Pseudomonas idahonensis]MDD1018094.1 trypsin-like peptidase domain-containing protein [Pseudomonas idahonensis]
MSLETTTAVLGDSPKARSKIIVTTFDGSASTDNFLPKTLEKNVAENPEPVSEFVKDFRSDTEFLPNKKCKPSKSERDLFLYQPEVIIWPDDRIRVTNTRAWPYSVQGHMIMRFPNGKVYIGSGTMISKHHVLTAGHCVYSKEDGGWATSVQFNAAQNDATLPFGSVYSSRLLSVTGWTTNNDRAYDIGMLILQSDLGAQTGWFGIITVPEDSELIRKRVNVTGYPGDKGGQQMWTHADAIKSLTQENAYYDIDTVGGQSGSGVWSTFSGHTGEKVACIHTTGASTGNGATRISRPKFDRIVDWMQNY